MTITVRARVTRTWVVLALTSSAAVLQGCGGGGGSSSAAAAPIQGSVDHAPTISGTPATGAQVGKSYSFTPQAADADGDKLTFSITNKPAWASFDASTGALTGTPTAGTFANVTISVSDGQQSASLAAFSISVAAASPPPAASTGSAQLAWTPPITRADGSAFTDLAGYHLMYGPSQGNYTSSITVPAGVTSYVVENLSAGVYYFALTSYDSSGLESGFSAAVSKTIQ